MPSEYSPLRSGFTDFAELMDAVGGFAIPGGPVLSSRCKLIDPHSSLANVDLVLLAISVEVGETVGRDMGGGGWYDDVAVGDGACER